MSSHMPELEARLVEKKVRRIEAAKAELARASTFSLVSFLWVAPWLLAVIFGERLAHFYGISSQLLYLLLTLFGTLFAFAGQTIALQHKVNALSELAKVQAEREGAA